MIAEECTDNTATLTLPIKHYVIELLEYGILSFIFIPEPSQIPPARVCHGSNLLPILLVGKTGEDVECLLGTGYLTVRLAEE